MNGNDDWEHGDEYNNSERIKLIKTANRLSIGFGSWAIVIAVVGTVALILMNRIITRQDVIFDRIEDLKATVILIKERQDVILRRVDRIEDSQDRADRQEQPR